MEQYVYIIRLMTDDYMMPHVKAFVDRQVADEYFGNDVIYYRKQGWTVLDDPSYCGGAYTVRKADMLRKNENGDYEHATLILDAFEIIKK